MTVLAAHQPQYLPWLGFFDKMAQVDVFVLLDNVQFRKNEWQNRNRIKGPSGAQWITVPIRHRFPQTIAEVEVVESQPWRRKHLRALESNYGKAPFFDQTMPLLANILEQPRDDLASLNIVLIEALADRLGIKTEMRIASEVKAREDPTLRLVDLCEELGADTYLSGAGGDYLDLSAFTDSRIAVRFQEFEHPIYPQIYGEFESHLSVVDLLMNCGSESFSIIESGRLDPR